MGNALQEQGKMEEAIEAYSKAYPSSLIMKLPERLTCINRRIICNWDSIAKDVNLIPELGTSEKRCSTICSLVFRGCT